VDKKVCYLCLADRDSVFAAKIAATIFPSTEPAIGKVAVVEPPLVIHDTQPQDPQPPQSPLHIPPGDLDLPLHPRPIVEPGPQPLQVEPILTKADTVPKVSAIRQEVRRVFQEDEAWAVRVSEYTMQEKLLCRPRMKASHGSRTCGTLWCLEIYCE
jgi:hypothetical protein